MGRLVHLSYMDEVHMAGLVSTVRWCLKGSNWESGEKIVNLSAISEQSDVVIFSVDLLYAVL